MLYSYCYIVSLVGVAWRSACLTKSFPVAFNVLSHCELLPTSSCVCVFVYDGGAYTYSSMLFRWLFGARSLSSFRLTRLTLRSVLRVAPVNGLDSSVNKCSRMKVAGKERKDDDALMVETSLQVDVFYWSSKRFTLIDTQDVERVQPAGGFVMRRKKKIVVPVVRSHLDPPGKIHDIFVTYEV